MQSYISYLLKDLEAAKRSEAELIPRAIEDHFEEVERFVTEIPTDTLGQHCGLYKEQFPKAEKLSLEQCRKVVAAIKAVFSSFGVTLVLPQKLPIEVVYHFHVWALDEKCFINDFGMTGIEICEYDSKSCPFGIYYCSCKELDTE